MAHGAEGLVAGAAEADEDRAAVGPLAAPLGKAGGFEPVDEPRDGAGGEAEPAGKLAHAHVAAGEHGQRLQLRRRDAAPDPPVEPARNPPAEQRLLTVRQHELDELVELLSHGLHGLDVVPGHLSLEYIRSCHKLLLFDIVANRKGGECAVEAHAHFLDRLRGRVPHLQLAHRETSTGRLAAAGAEAGLAGLVVLAAPLVIYDWAKASHSALELPMAVTGWLFGLDHFTRNGYHWWPIVIGALFLIGYCALMGIAFAGLAGRVYRIGSLAGALALGAAWSIASFLFFWDMLLPIARDGAPFRETIVAPAEFAAPAWVWILAFAVFGLGTGIAYRLLARRTAIAPAQTATAPQQQAA